MTDAISDQPSGATAIDDASGLLQEDVRTRTELDEAETLNILNAHDWLENGRILEVFTVQFYRQLHTKMFDQVWVWAGALRSQTGVITNIGSAPAQVPTVLGEIGREFDTRWHTQGEDLISFLADYHHRLLTFVELTWLERRRAQRPLNSSRRRSKYSLLGTKLSS